MTRLTSRTGFEVRLLVGTEDGQEVTVVTTSAHSRALRLAEGTRIWFTPSSGAATGPAMTPALASVS